MNNITFTQRSSSVAYMYIKVKDILIKILIDTKASIFFIEKNLTEKLDLQMIKFK